MYYYQARQEKNKKKEVEYLIQLLVLFLLM